MTATHEREVQEGVEEAATTGTTDGVAASVAEAAQGGPTEPAQAPADAALANEAAPTNEPLAALGGTPDEDPPPPEDGDPQKGPPSKREWLSQRPVPEWASIAGVVRYAGGEETEELMTEELEDLPPEPDSPEPPAAEDAQDPGGAVAQKTAPASMPPLPTVLPDGSEGPEPAALPLAVQPPGAMAPPPTELLQAPAEAEERGNTAAPWVVAKSDPEATRQLQERQTVPASELAAAAAAAVAAPFGVEGAPQDPSGTDNRAAEVALPLSGGIALSSPQGPATLAGGAAPLASGVPRPPRPTSRPPLMGRRVSGQSGEVTMGRGLRGSGGFPMPTAWPSAGDRPAGAGGAPLEAPEPAETPEPVTQPGVRVAEVAEKLAAVTEEPQAMLRGSLVPLPSIEIGGRRKLPSSSGAELWPIGTAPKAPEPVPAETHPTIPPPNTVVGQPPPAPQSERAPITLIGQAPPPAPDLDSIERPSDWPMSSPRAVSDAVDEAFDSVLSRQVPAEPDAAPAVAERDRPPAASASLHATGSATGPGSGVSGDPTDASRATGETGPAAAGPTADTLPPAKAGSALPSVVLAPELIQEPDTPSKRQRALRAAKATVRIDAAELRERANLPYRSEPAAAVHAAPPARASRTSGLVWAGLCGFVIVAAALGGRWWTTRDGTLRIEVQGADRVAVASAEIFVDDHRRCAEATCSIEVKPGVYRVRARAPGFEATDDASVQVEAGQRRDFVLQLVPKAEVKSGSLIVPAGAEDLKLEVDGRVYGQLPQRIDGLTPGRHRLIFRAADRPGQQEKEVELRAGETLQVEPESPVRPAHVHIEVARGTRGATVTFDDAVLLDLPAEMEVDPGEHVLRGTKRGTAPFEQRFAIGPGQSAHLEVKFGSQKNRASDSGEPSTNERPTSLGTLELDSDPPSRVVLDGRPLGMTPQRINVAPSDPHTVVFVHPETLVRRAETVLVQPGQTKSVSIRFE